MYFSINIEKIIDYRKLLQLSIGLHITTSLNNPYSKNSYADDTEWSTSGIVVWLLLLKTPSPSVQQCGLFQSLSQCFQGRSNVKDEKR